MALEFRPKYTNSFDLYDEAGKEGFYDETGHIGEIEWSGDWGPQDAPVSQAEPQTWTVSLWSNYGSGKAWDGDGAESLEEAMQWARQFYEELVADRREHSRGRSVPTFPVPMGGQRRRR